MGGLPIDLNSNFALSHAYRGYIFYQKDEHDKALTDLNKAIALDSMSAMAFVSRSLLFDKQNKLNDALADLNKAIELDRPVTAFTLANRGAVFYRQNK
ncbi:MAG: tetratricopeptide repeat protein [Legionella sp.]